MLEGYRSVIRAHMFDKCWSLDITWAEVADLLAAGTVIEEHRFDSGGRQVKQIRLLLEWSRPLHVVYTLDHDKRLAVFITIYEPDLTHWKPGFRERRRG